MASVILTADEIVARQIVEPLESKGRRATTYDATVGEILLEGIAIKESDYRLPRRGMVWVISKEIFNMPDDVTGLATLRTTWTHNGVLALNVGIVDPKWNGPLATALVNFSDKDFLVTKGDPFLRVLFHSHAHVATDVKEIKKSRLGYFRDIADKSARVPDTFLNLKALAREVSDQIFASSRWVNRLTTAGVIAAIIATLVALIAIFVPVAYGVSQIYTSHDFEIHKLREDITRLQHDQAILQIRINDATRKRIGKP